MSKKYLLIVIPLLVAFYVAQHFYSKNKLKDYLGNATALKNGVAWSARCSAKTSFLGREIIDISIKRIENEQGPNESLNFFKIPLKVGKHPLSGMAVMYSGDSLSGALFADIYHHKISNFYEIAQSDSSSYLEITGYDAEKAKVKGRFSLTLWHPINTPLINTPLSEGAPDSVVISNGTFEGRVESRHRRTGLNVE